LLIQLDTSRVHGFTQKTIYVLLGQPQWEEIAFTVQALVRTDVTVTPNSLDLGRVKRGSSPEASVTAQLFGSADCKALDATCDSPYVEVRVRQVQRDAGPVSFQVAARLRPDCPVGKWDTTVWLVTDNPVLPRLQIPLTVEVGPALKISPASAALGQVKRGTEARRTFIIRADQPFRIVAVKGTDAQIQVEEGVQASTAVHLLKMTFQASSPGVVLRTIYIVTDLPGENRIDFEVTAEIVP